MVQPLAESLVGHFVIVNLGAASDVDYDIPARFRRAVTLVEIDATAPSRSKATYHQRHTLDSVIAGDAGTRVFRQRRFAECSSLLTPRPELIAMYGLERYYEVVDEREVSCRTLPEVLAERGIPTLDFLKTDLEGLDFEVIRSCETLLPRVLAIQCELRFQPFYVGEPFMHEVTTFLQERGFELIGLTPAFWRPRGPHWGKHWDGRVVYADCLFMRNPETVTTSLSQAKQVLLGSMAGRRGYAAYLLEYFRAQGLPALWVNDLQDVVAPKKRRGPTLKRRFANLAYRYLIPPPWSLRHLADG
jgi:FkbM family methyltransferase